MIGTVHGWSQSIGFRLAHLIGCHQRADRSYFIRGRQVPLCARCLGIGIGLIIAPVAALVFSLSISIVLLAPMLLDGGTQWCNLRESRNGLRLVTGFGFGLGSGAILFRAFTLIWIT